MNKNILLCGVGGQGTILASKLLAAAAMKKGIPVFTAETIGMAQRGGSVTSHLRMGPNLFSPLLRKGSADLILAFEPGEAVRNLPFLKKDGIIIVNTHPVRPVSGSLSGLNYSGLEMIDFLLSKNVSTITIDAAQVATTLGSSKALNVVLLGAAANTGSLGISKDELKAVILEKVPKKFHELNLRALDFASSL